MCTATSHRSGALTNNSNLLGAALLTANQTLLQYPAGCGQWLTESRLGITQAGGHNMQVGCGQCDVLRKAAWFVDDAQHLPGSSSSSTQGAPCNARQKTFTLCALHDQLPQNVATGAKAAMVPASCRLVATNQVNCIPLRRISTDSQASTIPLCWHLVSLRKVLQSGIRMSPPTCRVHGFAGRQHQHR